MTETILTIFFTTCIVSLIWLMVLRKEIKSEIKLIKEHDRQMKDYQQFHQEQVKSLQDMNENLLRRFENYKRRETLK